MLEKPVCKTGVTATFFTGKKSGQKSRSLRCRERLVGIMGQEKIGKTWNLLEFILNAARQRCNTLFFQAGDMTETQQKKRIFTRLSKKAPRESDCGEQLFPILDCVHNQFDDCLESKRECDFGIVGNDTEWEDIFRHRGKLKSAFEDAEDEGYQPCTYCRSHNKFSYRGSVWYEKREIEHLKVGNIMEATRKFKKRMKGKNFKLISHPNDSLTIGLIKSHIEYFINVEGFIPDVIAVDYPEIMASESHEDRPENAKWKGLRSISQIYNCLVLAPTQADAESYGKKSLGLKNFTEDKRKYSHVTCMLSLNRTHWETVAGIIRLGKLLVREAKMEPYRQVKILQHFQTGQPWVQSYF